MESFKDTSEKLEKPDLHQNEYKEIQPSGASTKAEALDYWNDIFSDTEQTESDGICIEDFWPEIYDCSENEFSFEFELDDYVKDLLEYFEEDWETLDDSEKRNLVEDLADWIGEKLELEEIPEIEYYDGSGRSLGSYNKCNNKICINEKLLDHPRELLDTIPHEMRHAYQYFRAGKLETDQDFLYKLNFDNYISPLLLSSGKYMFFTDYQDQLVEAEARAFAQLFQ